MGRATDEAEALARAGCEGVVALPARLERWQLELCGQPELVGQLIDEHGSPVNLLEVSPMSRNATELRDAAARFEIDLQIYFARKANKALGFVDEARRLGLGIDLASEPELAQVLQRGIPGSALVMSAAVKPDSLLELCIASGTTVVIDNRDELHQLRSLADRAGRAVPIALRLAPALGGERVPTRFGSSPQDALAMLEPESPAATTSQLIVEGVHFHLDAYETADRVIAVSQALELIEALRAHGHNPTFIDIGGGIPVSYIDSAEPWDQFWTEHSKGLLGRRPPLTFDGHGLGLVAHGGEIIGSPDVYPCYQRLTRASWLAETLSGQVASAPPERSVADVVRASGLQLRCEPGRALLDGCGITAARVAYRKQRRDGTWLIGVEMNRTQCRSTSADFLVDPLLIRPSEAAGNTDRGDREPTTAIEGYVVGAYCIERELLTWRRMRFPHGVAVGDIVIFPNTAGYLMHILESSSHQIPLARNVIVAPNRAPRLDPIDLPAQPDTWP